MVKQFGLVLFFSLGLAGCATTKEWGATGGSRADGTVKLSYQYGLFEKPQVSAQQGIELAKSKCAAWGYTDAEPFGAATRSCNNYSTSGCNSWLVTAEYQCLGSPKQ